MKTKREVLETFVEHSMCFNIDCHDCPFKEDKICDLSPSLIKLGAKEMLKTLPRELDKTKILESKPKIEQKIAVTYKNESSLNNLNRWFSEGWTVAHITNHETQGNDRIEYILQREVEE